MKHLFQQFLSIRDEQLKQEYEISNQSKEYKHFEKIHLPEPTALHSALSEVLSKRSSYVAPTETEDVALRDFETQTLSNVLFWSHGKRKNENSSFTYYPIAGGVSCLEVYVAVSKNMPAIDRGQYHYYPEKHLLECMPHVEVDTVTESFVKQRTVKQMPNLVFIISANVQRLYHTYGIFSFHLATLEAGHLLQNIALTVTAEQRTSRLYSFKDPQALHDSLELPENEIIIETIGLY